MAPLLSGMCRQFAGGAEQENESVRNVNPWSTRVLSRASEMVSFTSLLVAIGCGGDSGNADLSASTLCARGCARATAANCARPDPMCTVECEQELASSPPGCSQQLNAFASCMTKATFTCDPNGKAEAKECDTQIAAWTTCQQIAGGSDAGIAGNPGGDASVSNTSDAGATSPSTDSGDPNVPATDSGTPVAAQDSGTTIPVVDSGTTPIPVADGGPIADAGGSDASTIDFSCTPNPSEDACDQCFKAECCTELTACGPDCMALLTCIDACDTSTCVQDCFTSYPSAEDQFNVLADCEETNCAQACDDTTGTSSSKR